MRVHFAPQSTLYISLLDVKSGPYNNGHGLSLLTGAATLFSVVKASFILGRNSPVTYSVALAPKMYVIRETNLDEMDEQRRLFDRVGYSTIGTVGISTVTDVLQSIPFRAHHSGSMEGSLHPGSGVPPWKLHGHT